MIFPYLDLFLKNYAVSNHHYITSKFTQLGEWMDQRQITLSTLTKIQMAEFLLTVVNDMKIRKKTKGKYKSTYNKYFKMLRDYNLIKDSPIPESEIKFTDYISDKVAKKHLIPELRLADVEQLIAHAKRANKRMYVFLVLLAYNGMRPSELRSLKLNLINFNTKAIISGVVPGCQKEFLCIYFIPDKFIPYLMNYITELKALYRDPEYLFEEPTSKKGFISEKSVASDLRKYRDVLQLNCKVNPHSFRGMLNFERFISTHSNDALMAILLNQIPKGTNAEFYLKQLHDDIKERRHFWVEFTPDIKI